MYLSRDMISSRCHLAREGLTNLVKVVFMLQKDDEDVRCKKKIKITNHLIDEGKVEAKRNNCWPDQVALNL